MRHLEDRVAGIARKLKPEQRPVRVLAFVGVLSGHAVEAADRDREPSAIGQRELKRLAVSNDALTQPQPPVRVPRRWCPSVPPAISCELDTQLLTPGSHAASFDGGVHGPTEQKGTRLGEVCAAM